MKVLNEPGVLPSSERFFSTPSTLATRLFFYVTRIGHYYCDSSYDFRHSCDLAKLDSHKNYFLVYMRQGTLFFEADGSEFSADRGQVVLIDCRKPHRYYAKDYVELLWLHFDGANAADFYEHILSFKNGRHLFTLPPENRIERNMTEIITTLRNGESLTEAEHSMKIYNILCGLLFPSRKPVSKDDHPIAHAICYINEHLYEDLALRQLADHVGLSLSHFSRQFRSYTGFSPHEYIILHRIGEAKLLLHSTSLSVKEIAYQTGYHSEVNFIASFTDKVGVSPTSFRKTLM